MEDGFDVGKLAMRVVRNVALFFLTALLCGLIGMLMGACRSVRYVSVPEYHEVYKTRTDSVLKHDSIWVRDSVSVLMRGDTVWRERWHTQTVYKCLYKTKTDTVLKTDSVRVPYPVEKKLGWWERTKVDMFWPICCVCGIFFVTLWWIIRRRRDDGLNKD